MSTTGVERAGEPIAGGVHDEGKEGGSLLRNVKRALSGKTWERWKPDGVRMKPHLPNLPLNVLGDLFRDSTHAPQRSRQTKDGEGGGACAASTPTEHPCMAGMLEDNLQTEGKRAP